MQPYFFPYIGYWQLINAVDEYIIYDDVNFIKGGWINRNRILMRDEPQYFNVRMCGMSSFKKINEIEVDPSPIWRKKALSTIIVAYKKAPYFSNVFPLLEDIILFKEKDLSRYITNSILKINEYLKITTKLQLSSSLQQNYNLHGQDRVIDICKRLKATSYYNTLSGENLYSKDVFYDNNIKLYFLKTHIQKYPQYKNEFIPNLSIIDVMMFNSFNRISEMLGDYELV